jgi:hypothetical protein
VRESRVTFITDREIEKGDGNESKFLLIIQMALAASDETCATIQTSIAKQRIIMARDDHMLNMPYLEKLHHFFTDD